MCLARKKTMGGASLFKLQLLKASMKFSIHVGIAATIVRPSWRHRTQHSGSQAHVYVVLSLLSSEHPTGQGGKFLKPRLLDVVWWAHDGIVCALSVDGTTSSTLIVVASQCQHPRWQSQDFCSTSDSTRISQGRLN